MSNNSFFISGCFLIVIAFSSLEMFLLIARPQSFEKLLNRAFDVTYPLGQVQDPKVWARVADGFTLYASQYAGARELGNRSHPFRLAGTVHRFIFAAGQTKIYYPVPRIRKSHVALGGCQQAQ